MQELSGEQSRQAAVALEQLFMQTPAQRTADLLLREHQSREQLWKLARTPQGWGQKSRMREVEGQPAPCPASTHHFHPLVVKQQVLAFGDDHL